MDETTHMLLILLIAITCSLIPAEAGYLGCYKEQLRRRNFAKNPGGIKVNDVTPANCYTVCGGLGYPYAGLGNGFQCFCSKTDPDTTTMTKEPDDTKCSVNCYGDSGQKCGSPTHISVYDAIQPLAVSSAASSKIISTGNSVTISPTVTSLSVAVASYNLKFNYDDGSYNTEYAANGAGLLVRSFHMAGEYDIQTFVTNTAQTLADVRTKTSVLVHTPVSGVTLTCPSQMATHEPEDCTLEVLRGTDMSVTFTYTDGVAITKSFQLGDAIEAGFGNPPMAKIDTSNSAYKENLPSGGLFLLNRNNVQTAGRLAGIEYVAVNSGNVKIGIYRPLCSDYCFTQNECGGCTSDTCSISSEFCIDLESCCDANLERQPLPTYDLSFQMEKTFPVSAGFHYLDLSSELFDVQPGDTLVLQVQSGDNLIAIINDPTTGNQSDIYCDTLFMNTGNILQSQCTGDSGKIHQIQAIYSTPSKAKLPLEFSNGGNVVVQAVVSNRQISASATDSATINVLEGVDVAIFDLPTCLESGTPVILNLLPFTGTSVTVDWTFGDTQTASVTTAPFTQVQHTYSATGTYNIAVNISNSLSYKYNTTHVCVQERITNLVYSIPEETPGVVKMGVDLSSTLTMSSGSDYTCIITFDFADGSTVSNTMTHLTGPSAVVSFTISGTMTVTTYCSNSVNNETHTQTLKAVEFITGVVLAPSGAVVGYDFQVIVEWATGSGVTITATYDSDPLTMTLYDSDRRAISTSRPADNVIGSHNVYITLTNEVNTVTITLPFSIEALTTGVVMDCTYSNQLSTTDTTIYTVISVGSSVTCTASVQSGTNIEYTVEWCNGTSPYSTSTATATAWSAFVTQPFTIPETCNITVSIKNLLTTETKFFPIIVMAQVGNIFLNSVPYVIFTPPADVTFTWNLTAVTHVPNGVMCDMQWGDQNSETIQDCDLTQSLIHSYYDEAGILNLTYTISNLISSQSGWITVEVITPIRDMECFTSPKAFPPNEFGKIVVKFRRAPGAGVLDLDFDCDTNTAPAVELRRKRMYESPDGEDSFNCSFSTPGSYSFSITATSLSESQTCTESFKVLNPVEDAFDVQTNAPIDYDFMSACALQIKIDYTGAPLPDEANMLFDLGDGNVVGPIVFANGYTLNHNYVGPGHYLTNVTIYNDAATVTKIVNTGCYEKFKDVTMTLYRKPFLPLDSADLVPLATNPDTFLVTDVVKIHTNMSAGTLVWWEVTAVSGSKLFSCNTTDMSVLSLSITTAGIYNLSVLPHNILFAEPLLSQNISVVAPAKNIAVSDYGITTAANVTKNFLISMEQYGTEMCVKVFGGVTSKPKFHGHQPLCNQSSDYDPGNIGQLNVSQAFVVSETYPQDGNYNLTVIAWTEFSSPSTVFEFAVSSIDCKLPTPIIQQSATFDSPMTFLRSKRIKIVGLTNIHCNYTLKNQKLWTVERWDQNTNTKISDVDITALQSYNHSELSIDPLGLEYGVYRLAYKITMDITSAEEFAGTQETFIEVVASDLIVHSSASQMNQWSVGPAVILTLDPKLYSYDPDSDTSLGMDASLDTFVMSCRDVTNNSESFELPPENETITAYNLTDLPAGLNKGGCFNQGSGWLIDFNGVLIVNTSVFEEGHTYEFFVNGTRNTTRFSNNTVRVKVVHAIPPDFKIDFKVPSIFNPHPEGKLFNPNNQLGLVANVSSVCNSCPSGYVYEWKMFAHDYQFCDLNKDEGCWRELTYLPIYIEGIHSQGLTIKTAVFVRYPSVNKFQVRLMVTDPVQTVTGEVYLNLIRNRPPFGGKCSISPTSGVSFNDKFTVRCENFTDADHALNSYRVYCAGSGSSVAGGLDTGDSVVEWTDITLPLGDAANSFSLSCVAHVTDSLNSVGTYDIDPVIVTPPVITDVRDLMGIMRNQTKDQSDIVDSMANLDATCSFVSSLTALISITSRDDENSEYSDIGSAVLYRRTQLDETGNRTNAFQTIAENKTKLEEYDTYRDNTGAIFTQAVNTIYKLTFESSSDIGTVARSLEDLSANVEYLNREAQTGITNLIQQSVAAIKRNIETNTATVEDVEAIGSSAISTCGNIQQASVLSANYPTKTDILTQEATMYLYNTDYNSDMDATGTFDNDEDRLNDGMKISNKVVQQQFTSSNIADCDAMKNEIVDLLVQIKPKSDIPTEFSSNSVDMKLYKNDPAFFNNAQVSTTVGDVNLPDGVLDDLGIDETVVFSVLGQVSAGEADDDQPVSMVSGKLSIKFQYENGTEKKMTNLKNPIDVGIKQDANQLRTSFDDIDEANPEIHDDYLFYHKVTVTQINSAIEIIFRPTNITSTSQFLVLVNFNELPAITADRSKLKKSCMIPSHTRLAGTYGGNGVRDPYACFIESDIVGENIGDWNIGIRQLQIPELNIYFSIDYLPLSVPNSWRENILFTQNYKIKSAVITCVYFEDGSNVVKYDGVKPLDTSTEDQIFCSTFHLTTFSGGFAVAPNTIDWNFIFSNADFLKNPTLYITEMLILLFYIMAIIWARRKDKQDVTKLGLAPLLDNDKKDKYYYEIMVNTGMRRNAGTESKVHFILSGEEDETEVRTFTDKKRKIMCRGNTDGFLMAVPSCLGALNYLRIWHDNSGRGKMASWYLNYIVIRDVQTDKKYYFIVNRWFAVEEDDGQVDRVIPIAGKEQMTEFSHLFAERASKNLSDGHLWFSVVARPPQSRFTRCQRVSCCLCLLYVSMLANAMFYELATSNSSAVQFGPFALSLEQIYVGVICNIIIFPVNFLIMTLFRKSRPRKLRPSRVEEALKSNPQRTTSMTDVNPRVKSSLDGERPGSSFLMDTKRSASSMSRPESSMSAVAVAGPVDAHKGKKKWQLPWWCVIVAWVLLWLVVLVSAAFVTFYGIMFQDEKCKKWITSLLISFFTSIFLTQPIKVFLFAIVFSLIVRKPENDQDEDDDEEPRKQLETDEEFLYKENEDYSLVGPTRPMYKPKPPNARVLETARQLRLKEIQMWSVIREIVIYAFFLWILMVISYKSVSSNSYNYKNNMEKVFITTNDTDKAYFKVKNVEDFWVWAKSGMLRGLRAGPYYNNYPPFYLRGYINDKVSRLMGHAVLRQLRIEPGSCRVPSQVDSVIDECNAPYEITKEERRPFGPGWTDYSTTNTSREEYMYQDASTLEGFPYWGQTGVLYSGGGYVYRLNKDYLLMVDDFNQMESEKWIDEYTRAVFLEFTVYNPSINLFAISTLLAEFKPSGGVVPTYRFEPCTLLPYQSGVLIFQVICEIIYLLFIVYFVVKEARSLYKQRWRYFLEFWNIIEFSICAMSVTATVIYFYRLVCINELSNYFKETSGNGYMKFQYVGYWSELFNYIIGFLVYFASLKFLKLLRFNKRISLLADTLKNSARDLMHFSVIFNIVFLAFVQVFYLVYHSHLDIFKTFMSSCEAGIVMMMGKFDIYNMSEVNSWFTPLFVFLFVVTITFIVVNMFLSILNDTFGSVRSNLSKQQNDHEIVDFMLNRFKVWTGLGRNNSSTISPADMEAERARNYQTLEGQIDYFPNQIDRFLASISNMYMEKSKFDDFLSKGAYGKMMMKAQAQNEPFGAHPPPSHPGALRISNGARGMTNVQTD